MKKSLPFLMLVISFSIILIGCSIDFDNTKNDTKYDSGYQDGYDLGYNDGYAEGYRCGFDSGFESGVSEENYEEQYLEFQSAIISLIYDYEYETIEKMLEYYPEAVESFLEEEFGTANLSNIIEYLESERTLYSDTVVGKCKYCGNDVCHKDAIHWVEILESLEYNCAHKNCFNKNNPSATN